MRLESLSLQNFRSIDLFNINFKKTVNIICGANNAGKTTLLESLFFCSNLKSFKSIPNSNLINSINKQFKLSLNFTNNQLNNTIYIEKSSKSSKCLYNNKKISKKDLSLNFPCYSLVFGFNNIILNDSSYRRDFIDSGMFHVEPLTHNIHSAFNKTLKQRNYLLKSKNLNNIDFWNDQLITHNEALNKHRHEYFISLEKEFKNILNTLKHEVPEIYNDISSLKLEFSQGWNGDYHKFIEENLEKDINIGYTTQGTHRCDIQILSKNKPVKESGSMSTLVLSCLLIYLAKINVFHVKHNFKPLLLIDDLFFGIDNKNLNTVVKLLVRSKGNMVLTAPNIYKDILNKISEENKEIKIITVGDN